MTRAPAGSEALFLLGAIQFVRGNAAGAAGLFARALTVRPDHTGAVAYLGQGFNLQRRFAEALEGFDKARR